MKELIPAKGVYVSQGQYTILTGAQSASDLLTLTVRMFFTREKLAGSNLTGDNKKRMLPAEIVDAITGKNLVVSFCFVFFNRLVIFITFGFEVT